MIGTHPDVVRADFQRFYGLNIDYLGDGLNIRRAADLAANLPLNASIWKVFDERATWSTEAYLLAEIADAVSFNAWTKTKAAQSNGKWKSSIIRPGQESAGNTEKTGSMNPDDLLTALYG
ncbi:hypothetical protein EJ419_07340 [Alloscardovia theropitheci]|uniref:Uncharacterized protein n=1 Tax=Alloscardovia theropitheci TaxID=2496842 RepID=A0A4R0QNJ5_9BIFI|nr:DUF5361 domain-containing protein [Alloscardovia theropitheci]TCD53772.1 hypothetical protein EJ419_07340 [Alloscardovia theropitheci]